MSPYDVTRQSAGPVFFTDTELGHRYQCLRSWHIEAETKWSPFTKKKISNAFSWMKMYQFRLRFHWNLVPNRPINNIPALVQIMAWRRPGDKPLSELMNLFNWRIYASHGLNELKTPGHYHAQHWNTFRLAFSQFWQSWAIMISNMFPLTWRCYPKWPTRSRNIPVCFEIEIYHVVEWKLIIWLFSFQMVFLAVT